MHKILDLSNSFVLKVKAIKPDVEFSQPKLVNTNLL